VASIAELHLGLLVATDDASRALRATRLGLLEARFPDPLALDDRIAREWGRLQAAVAQRGGKPRDVPPIWRSPRPPTCAAPRLLTHNLKDFDMIADLVRVQAP
jgi:hypothetical protein